VNREALKSIKTEPVEEAFYHLIRKRYAGAPLSISQALQEGGGVLLLKKLKFYGDIRFSS
jgi:hypothetical protein